MHDKVCEGIKMLIGIDPGAEGGLSWEFNEKIHARKMPDTPRDICDFLRELATLADGYGEVKCIVEKVGGYMPGNSGPAATKFARHCGNLEGILIALNIPFVQVTPQKWMKYFIGVRTYPAYMTSAQKKTRRKNLIKKKCQELYPHLRITLSTADALGILDYAMR